MSAHRLEPVPEVRQPTESFQSAQRESDAAVGVGDRGRVGLLGFTDFKHLACIRRPWFTGQCGLLGSAVARSTGSERDGRPIWRAEEADPIASEVAQRRQRQARCDAEFKRAG